MKNIRRRILLTVLSVIIALGAAGIMEVSAFWGYNVPEIVLANGATTEVTTKIGETFRVSIVVLDSASLINNFILEDMDYGDLIRVSGINTGSALTAYRNVSFTFRVPRGSPSIRNISYTISYEHIHPISGDVFSGSRTFNIPITVTDGVEPVIVQPVLENVKTSGDVFTGSDFEISADIFAGTDTISDAVLTVNSGGNQLARRYIGVIESGAVLPENTFRIPGFDTTGDREFIVTLTYKDITGTTLTASKNINVKVLPPTAETAPTQPILENLNVIDSPVVRGEAFELNADIFGGSNRITNAALTVRNSAGSQLTRTFLGTVEPNVLLNETLKIPGINATGNQVLTVEFSYRDKDGTNQSATKNITVAVNPAPETIHPTLENLIVVNNELFIGEAFELNVDIFPGSEKITGAVLRVRNGTTEFPHRFIGVIEAGTLLTENTLPIPGINTAGNQTLTVTLSYTDKNGVNHSVSKNTTVRILTAAEAEAGLLRIQDIAAPIKIEIDTHAEMTFTLTNPTATEIKGVEAFLYNDSGILLTSVYIREAETFSSEIIPLSFPVTGRTGARSYRLVVNYKNAENASKSLNGSFIMTVLTSDEAEEDERPSNLRIQRVEAPAQIFTSVRTNIPFVVVNAGRGTAYNVEVYVVDESGAEIAREYIGNIPAAESAEGEIPLRFNDPGNYSLTFHAIGENADETLTAVSRNFEIRTVNYRVNIADIAGHEWIWNNMTTLEFAVINGGSEEMLNVNAQLADEDGNVFGEVYIGTIQPGEKKERIRFRDIFIWDDGIGFMELSINLTYENEDMQEFPFSHTFTAFFSGDNWDGGDDGWDDDRWPEVPWDEDEESGSFWLIVALTGGALIVAGAVITIIVVSRKKKKRDEDDDIDYFLSQMKADSTAAETQADSHKEEITQ
jgi:hypothetical protein